MNVDLHDKIALVTGAARGIGQAIANTLADNGARVAYTDIDVEAVHTAAGYASNSIALEMDIQSETQVDAVVGQVLAECGRIDILVNNAGINTIQHRVNIDQFPLDEWERIVKVDLTGTYLVSKAVSRPMIRQKSGRIINIASVLGVVPARQTMCLHGGQGGRRSIDPHAGNRAWRVWCVGQLRGTRFHRDRRHPKAVLWPGRRGKGAGGPSAQPCAARPAGHC